MELFLVRHGEARAATEDSARSLTDRGEETVRRMAAWASGAGLRVAQIRHSGKRRAAQTAQILADHLNPAEGVIPVSGLAPNDDVHAAAEAIESQNRPLMLVGHLPFLDHLAALLTTGVADASLIEFQTAGMACLSGQHGAWAIEWVVTPDIVG